MTGNTNGKRIEDVDFENNIIIDGIQLKLNGVGLLRYMIVIKAYVGAFYLPDDVFPQNALSDYPKRLELSYFHAISAKDFSIAMHKKIKDNIHPSEYKRLKPKIDIMGSLYRAVQPGDRYSLTYIPEKGTTLALNNKNLGTIEGSDFASAMFSIWIGKNPIDKSFRKKLLGE